MMRKVRLLLYTLFIYASAFAQNATSSPSSRFGLGELNDNIPAEFRAMGGVSTGMRSSSVIDPSQPASYTSCDSLTFMFDLAGSAMWTNYSDVNGHRNRANGNLEYVTLQFPLYKRYIAFSAGLMPYSTMGYDFSIAGATGGHNYTITYSGEGNIAQAYGGLSFNICDWFALGANFYYMFGDLQNSTSLAFYESSLVGSLMYRTMHVSSWRGRYGAQFFHSFDDKHAFVLGAIFESKLNLKGTYLQYELNTVDSVMLTDQGFDVPMIWGVGGSYTYHNRLTFALDYTMQAWSKARYFDATGVLSDRGRWSAGFQYRHNPNGRKYVDRVYWRAGMIFADPYVSGCNKMDIGASIGVGLPLRTSATMINLTLDYNHRNATNTMQENVLKFTVSAAVNEHWFFKRKL